MAQRQTVTYVSDLSGKDITENDSPTVSFGWDGNDYQIDLTSAEAEKFYKAVEPYISAGTKVSKAKRTSKAKGALDGPTAQEVRFWAQTQNIAVPDRGRIPGEVRKAYDDAH